MSNWGRWYISLFHTDHKHLDVKSLSEGILKNVNVIDESYHKKSSLLCQCRWRLVPTWHLWIRHVSDHTPLLSLQITVSDYDDQRKDISTMYNRITLKQLQRMAPSVSITYTQKKTNTCEIKCNETREHQVVLVLWELIMNKSSAKRWSSHHIWPVLTHGNC